MVKGHTPCYAPCKSGATENLHGTAFHLRASCWILPYMARKHKSYIREWRKKRGYTQKVLLARLAELSGDGPTDDPSLKIPTTEASLSRIEAGKQNFSMATLEALAVALDVEEPGWLLSRNPNKEGIVISFLEKLDEQQARQAETVLHAMFGSQRG